MGFFRVMKIGAKLTGFTAQLGMSLAAGAVRGAVSTAGTVAGVAKDIVNGRYERAGDRIEQRIMGVCRSVDAALENTSRFFDRAEKAECIEEVLTSKNAKLIAGGTALGLAAIFAVDALDVDADIDADGVADSASDRLPPGAVFAQLDPSAVDNGMFVGDDSDLQTLIDAGKLPDTVHTSSEDIVRDIDARDEFLQMHGYEGVPEGYEVHHIVPLSEGGADTTDNMILVSEAEHDAITAAHRSYYGWNA